MKAAKAAGARFAVAPGLNPAVVQHAAQAGLPFCAGRLHAQRDRAGPGARLPDSSSSFRPSPAAAWKWSRPWRRPTAHTGIRFMPTGGVNAGNLGKYLAVKAVAAVGGTWIAKPEDLAGGRWQTIRDRCREAVEIVRNSVRGSRIHEHRFQSASRRPVGPAAALLATIGREDPGDRGRLRSGRRLAGFHGGREIYGPRLDGMDAGFPVRFGRVAVRRHGPGRVPGNRPPQHGREDGPAREPRGRPRSRLQQRQHLRQPAAADGRRPDRGRPLGAPLLRVGAEAQRRGPGPAVDRDPGRRLHLFLQRAALAVRRHDPFAAGAGDRAQAGPRA